MNLSRKKLINLLKHKKKNQSKKINKKNKQIKRKHKNTFRKRKKNLRTSSLKNIIKKKSSKYKRKSYIKGGGKEEYINKFLKVILKQRNNTENGSLEDNKYYNFDFIFNRNDFSEELIDLEEIQGEFNIKAKSKEEKQEDTENEEIKKIEEKEDAVRKAKEHEINEETEEFIEKSKKNKGSIMYIYDGKAGPMVSIQNDENAINNWFMSISEYLKSV